MDAPDELRQAALDVIEAARGVLDVDTDGIPESQWRVLADAVLAVPAIADALERDRKVAEIVANPEPGSYPSGMVKGYSRIAALYPETGK